MAKLKDTYTITKSNALNEMRTNNMSLQELRLLSIYMSRINPLDKDTRTVCFSLAEFHAIMETNPKVRATYYADIAESLLRKIIKIPYKGGFKAFTLFNRVVFARESDEHPYYFEIDAHEDAMPLLFDLRRNFFKYELWNALRLRGKNQLRMYEILKQYEFLGYRTIAVQDLKEQLGIDMNDYPEYKFFKQNVLEPCRKALAELTDISYTYEPHSKKGRKIHELKFTITKNKKHKDPLSLDEFIDLKKVTQEDDEIDIWDMNEDDIDPATLTKYEERLIFFRSAVGGDFTKEQMTVLCDVLSDRMPHIFHNDQKCYDYLRRKYNEIKLKASQGEIRYNQFSYLKALIGTE